MSLKIFSHFWPNSERNLSANRGKSHKIPWLLWFWRKWLIRRVNTTTIKIPRNLERYSARQPRSSEFRHYAETTHTGLLRARPGKPTSSLSGTPTAGSERTPYTNNTVYHPHPQRTTEEDMCKRTQFTIAPRGSGVPGMCRRPEPEKMLLLAPTICDSAPRDIRKIQASRGSEPGEKRHSAPALADELPLHSAVVVVPPAQASIVKLQAVLVATEVIGPRVPVGVRQRRAGRAPLPRALRGGVGAANPRGIPTHSGEQQRVLRCGMDACQLQACRQTGGVGIAPRQVLVHERVHRRRQRGGLADELEPLSAVVVVPGTQARSALPRRAAPCAERRARSAWRRSGSPQAPGAQRPRHRRRARSARRRQLACWREQS